MKASGHPRGCNRGSPCRDNHPRLTGRAKLDSKKGRGFGLNPALMKSDARRADHEKRKQLTLVAQRSPQPAVASLAALGVLRMAVALALMATAANCFLKYLWWTACYSAWSGIPKMAAQWRAAATRSSFYGWSVIILELASVVLAYTAIRLRGIHLSPVRTALRLAASLAITLALTGFLALALSWVKQSR